MEVKSNQIEQGDSNRIESIGTKSNRIELNQIESIDGVNVS